MVGLAGLALGAMALAYLRPGGWPGVAGWEYGGMESPFILSATAAIATLAGPIVGLLGQRPASWARWPRRQSGEAVVPA